LKFEYLLFLGLVLRLKAFRVVEEAQSGVLDLFLIDAPSFAEVI